jgi:hypothetical protein
MPSTAAARRTAIGVGVLTTGIGGALAVAPEACGTAVGLTDTAGLRTIGVADLALVPGLVRGPRRWPWMVARGALNVGIVAYLLGRPPGPDAARRRLLCGALAGVTVQDLRVAAALRRAGA